MTQTPETGLIFRPMEGVDVERVAAIERQANAFPWTPGKIRDCLEAGYECWVSCLDDPAVAAPADIIGYAVSSSVLDEASLLSLCVAPRHQGRGMGRALLDFVLEHHRRHAINRVFLEVRASNARAITLYESRGFRPLHRRKAYYPMGQGEREDALVYSLESLSRR